MSTCEHLPASLPSSLLPVMSPRVLPPEPPVVPHHSYTQGRRLSNGQGRHVPSNGRRCHTDCDIPNITLSYNQVQSSTVRHGCHTYGGISLTIRPRTPPQQRPGTPCPQHNTVLSRHTNQCSMHVSHCPSACAYIIRDIPGTHPGNRRLPEHRNTRSDSPARHINTTKHHIQQASLNSISSMTV